MSTTAKINTIIKSLENIDPASLHGLCDDLISAGALIPELKNKPIDSTGWNPSKHHTIRSAPDSIIKLEEGLCVFEYSGAQDWVNKFKEDVSSIKQWTERESHKLARFIFITTRDIENKKINSEDGQRLSPEEFIKKELSQFNLQAYVFGQKQLLNVLRNSSYFHIRKEWLKIPEDYFQSLKSFESRHTKQAKDHHIYLREFVEDSLRQKSIDALKNFTSRTDLRILLIHSQGGIGKTRFALESLKRIKEETAVPNINILFNHKKKDVNIDEVIPEISEEQESLIVLDDAHFIDNLSDFTNILSERPHAKIILITRSTSKESVRDAIGYPIEELELTPLDKDSSIELLKSNLKKPLRDEYLKYAARICEGNPLLIGLTAYLINNNKIRTLRDLKTDDLARDYLEEILYKLDSVALDCYQLYLALLFLLKPFSINDSQTRFLIRSLVNINEVQEINLLKDLEKCNVLESHGDTLWLYPDLLGEYLIQITFFSDISLNFADVFSRIPPSHMTSVFETLRELDNDKADLFLKKWANNLLNELESQDTRELFNSLELLKIIVPTVTDQALQIIDFLLKPKNEKPPVTSEDFGISATREYQEILQQCLTILKNPSLRYFNFESSLERFLEIYFYKPESEEYSALRQAAFEAITKTVSYNLDIWEYDRTYSIQKRIFEKVSGWKQENLEKNFTLILRICEKLLEIEMKSEYWDSEGFGWSSGPLVVTDELICLRQDVISLLQSIFNEIQETEQQIEVIKALALAYAPEYPPQMQEDLQAMIQENTKILLDFYLALANRIPLLEIEVLHEIEQQAVNLKTWHAEYVEVIDKLRSVLQSHENYQLYRTIMGDHSLFWEEGEKGSEQVQTERAAKIREIAHGITDENLIKRLEQLNKIAEIALQNSDCDSSLFCLLLFEIGNKKTHIAKTLIDQSLFENNALKRFVAEFLRGIRRSPHSDIADHYVREWLSGKDQALILEIPRTYSGVDEKFLRAQDVELFDTLLHCRMRDKVQRQALDKHIMSNIEWIYNKHPAKGTEIICQLFARGTPDSTIDYIRQLWWARQQIDLSQWDLEVFEKILQKLVDAPILNSDAIDILAQYAQKAPVGLVRFFERRIEKQKQVELGGFRAIPYRLDEVAKMYQAQPQYSEVINQIMGWFQKDDHHYKWAAADLISRISPELDGPLKQILLNLVRSGNETSIRKALEILKKFPEDSLSDDLCKEAVKHCKGSRELEKHISFMIVFRQRGSSGIRGRITIFEKLKEKLCSWLEDENYYIRDFANRTVEIVENQIDYEEKQAAEAEIRRKKGFFG